MTVTKGAARNTNIMEISRMKRDENDTIGGKRERKGRVRVDAKRR